ncbi:hypothetical protein DM02DRAFT_266581 [Periconia macrospinosa]|uniref:Uncharacterized protein n=1 Tax=Periconia macrospinosa TaxID=97972 RepID=A0A2V1D3X2_9PLEO|nr:hypothetical protein DM02DRAFT_266581 [Periconia macrospinosa]
MRPLTLPPRLLDSHLIRDALPELHRAGLARGRFHPTAGLASQGSVLAKWCNTDAHSIHFRASVDKALMKPSNTYAGPGFLPAPGYARLIG